ncbi:MAG: phage tail tube protein [Oleiphilaceae bacterium]|nr:phage tail tube protein [Oleiphilaceae bacterium]
MANPQVGVDHEVGYIVESTIGTTPATPAVQWLPYTGTTLKETRELIQSERLGNAFNVGSRHGNNQVGGDVTGEIVYGAFDDLFEAAVGGTWATDTPVAGTDQLKAGTGRQGFTFVRKAGTIGYDYFAGCEINTTAIEVGQNGNATLTFGVIGTSKAAGHTEIAGSTYTAASSRLPIAGFDVTLRREGSDVAIATAISLNINRNLERSFVIGSRDTGAKPKGKLQVDGSLTLQYIDYTYADLFKNETRTDLEIVFKDTLDASGSELSFQLPNVLPTSADDDVSGDGEIPINVSFQAEYDDTEATNLIIERTAAP